MSQEQDRAARRRKAIDATIEDIRRIEAEDGVNRAALEKVKERLLRLAEDRALFPPEDYPLPHGKNGIYTLAQDPDGRFALYMSVGQTGKEVPPHNHTTWAVIVGLKGKEHNRFYRRTDDASVAGKGTVEVFDRFTVEQGTGCTLMPEDIHSIHLEGEAPTLMLHMYGLGLDHLHRRVAYDMSEGSYRYFPASDNMIDRTGDGA